MVWKINYVKSVQKDMRSFDAQTRKRIRLFIEQKLISLQNPKQIGEALKESELRNFWKFRIGNYRIICDIQSELLVILVIKIGDRKEVYK